MNQIINTVNTATMSSVELVSVINTHREKGKAELLHKNFIVKVENHPGIDSAKFLAQYKDSTGRSLKCYHLPKRECELMVMSESLAVQAKVYDRMAELEQRPVFVIPATLSSREIAEFINTERIHYNPATGQFTWAVSERGITKGNLAGSVNRYGYLSIKLGRISYRAGRLAWFISNGHWPAGCIDHINGDRLDNKLCNLRDVSHEMNMQNKRVAMRNNRSCGLLGVTWNKQHQRWQSKIMVNKVIHHVGLFDSAEEAHEAYVLKKRQLQPGCTI